MNKRYAVCVGNNYPGTNAELSGCVNDMLDWKTRLRAGGYEVTTLAEATKRETVSALVAAVDKVGWGDRLVFTYSGHGSWVTDRSGDEVDRRDECLVMSDYVSGGLLLDDEIDSIFRNLRRGAGALFLSDSCHSGTVSRLVDLTPERKPRFLSPARFTDLTADQVWIIEERVVSAPKPQRPSLISGCEDDEYSYDAWFGGRANGAFTRRALDTYQPGISLNNWHKAIRRTLPDSHFPQSPVLDPASLYRKYTRAL